MSWLLMKVQREKGQKAGFLESPCPSQAGTLSERARGTAALRAAWVVAVTLQGVTPGPSIAVSPGLPLSRRVGFHSALQTLEPWVACRRFGCVRPAS